MKKNRMWMVWSNVFRVRRGLATERVNVRASDEKTALKLGKIKLRIPKGECPKLHVYEDTRSSPCC